MILTTVVFGILGLMMQYFNVNRFLDFFHLLKKFLKRNY